MVVVEMIAVVAAAGCVGGGDVHVYLDVVIAAVVVVVVVVGV